MVYPLKMGGSFHTLYTPSTTRWSSTHLRTALSGHRSAEVLCFAVHLHLRVERLSAARPAFVFAFPNSAEKIPVAFPQMDSNGRFTSFFLHTFYTSSKNPSDCWSWILLNPGKKLEVATVHCSRQATWFFFERRDGSQWIGRQKKLLSSSNPHHDILAGGWPTPLKKKYFTSSDPHHDILTF